MHDFTIHKLHPQQVKCTDLKVKEPITTIRQAIESFAEFHGIDKKKTQFWLRQLELSGKL